MTSFIARISLFGSFKFTQTKVLKKWLKKLTKKKIVNFEPLCRFQPNARPSELRLNYTCENFSAIALNLNKFRGIFEEKNREYERQSRNHLARRISA